MHVIRFASFSSGNRIRRRPLRVMTGLVPVIHAVERRAGWIFALTYQRRNVMPLRRMDARNRSGHGGGRGSLSPKLLIPAYCGRRSARAHETVGLQLRVALAQFEMQRRLA